VSFLSDHDDATDMAAEVFVLDGPPDVVETPMDPHDDAAAEPRANSSGGF